MAASGDKCLITFWGARGSIPTPGRVTEKYGGNTPCVSARCGDNLVVFDAGTGIRELGNELNEEFENTAGQIPINIFLSHTHWDHIQGLPFFAPAYKAKTPITIFGSPRKEGVLNDVLQGQMKSSYFPVDMSNLGADITIQELNESELSLGEFKINWQEQIYHPGGTVRYSLNHKNKKLVYATDVELNLAFAPQDKFEEAKQEADRYLEFIADSDLLIADGQYTDKQYQSKMGWGHTSLSVLFDAAYQARVKRLAVFHHEPDASDRVLDDLYIKHSRSYCAGEHMMEIFWAREGMSLSL